MLINPYRFGGLWTPANITTALWLDAADASTVTTVSGAVSQWSDKSGNSRNMSQATAGNRPLYSLNTQNNLNSVLFDGSNDFMSLANDLSLGTTHTIIAAAKNTATITAATSAQVLASGGTYAYPSTTTSEYFICAGSLTGNIANERLGVYLLGFSNQGAANVYGYAKTDADMVGAFLLVAQFTTTENAFVGRLNGTSDFATVSSAGGFSTSNTNYPTYLRNIGSRYSSGTLFWNGNIYEFIVVPSAISTSQIQNAEGYLAHKWGLTANLPAGHPYKSAAPTI